MRIKRIRLERFRQFRTTTFECGNINVLVGPNNSGKTSLLHAIRAFFLLMKGHIGFEGFPPVPKYHRRFISNIEAIVPVPDLRELWFNQEAGKPIRITVTFEDEMSLTVVLRQQFGQVHASAENLPTELTKATVSKYLDADVTFIPGLVGVLVNEPYATAARRNSLATEGRYSEIFRSSLEQLRGKDPTLLEDINATLKDLFNVSVSRVSFDPETDEYVSVKYTEGAKEYDVVSCGSGLQQVIQMLTYLYLTKPAIVLIDEPDAHLHSRLQGALGPLFKRLSSDLGAQVFLSTHSLDLIDTFDLDSVIIVDSKKDSHTAIGEDTDLVSCLVDSGVVDVSSFSKVLASRKLVVVEDKDLSILKAFDRAVGSPLFSSASSSYVKPAEGVGNFRNLAELGNVLRAVAGDSFSLTFLQDRDGLPDFMEKPFLKSQLGKDVVAMLLKRHEIENYLISSQLILDAAKLINEDLDPKDVDKIIVKCASELRSRARRQSRESARQVNRHLSDQLSDADLEEKVDNWFDKLDGNNTEVIVTVWPGKELLKAVLARIKEDLGIQLTRGRLVAALKQEHVPEDLFRLLRQLGGQEEIAPTRASSRRRRRRG
jgi:ABC-type lipoprotein export system ATPase subunit